MGSKVTSPGREPPIHGLDPIWFEDAFWRTYVRPPSSLPFFLLLLHGNAVILWQPYWPLRIVNLIWRYSVCYQKWLDNYPEAGSVIPVDPTTSSCSSYGSIIPSDPTTKAINRSVTSVELLEWSQAEHMELWPQWILRLKLILIRDNIVSRLKIHEIRSQDSFWNQCHYA